MSSPMKRIMWISASIISLAVFLFPLAFIPQSIAPIFAHKTVLLTITLALLVTGVLYELVFLRICRYRQTILDIPIVGFVFIAIISTIFSVSKQASVFGSAYEFTLTLPYVTMGALWFLMLVYYIRQRQPWNMVITALLASAAVASSLFILAKTTVAQYLLPVSTFQAISSAHSSFGLFLAITATLSFGMLLIRRRSWTWQIMPAISAVLGLVAVIMLGFTLPLFIVVGGLGGLFVVGSIFMPETRVSVYSTIIALFVGAIILGVVGIPQSWKVPIPVEVAIGAKTSMTIVTDTITHSVSNFFIGSGPGTFIHDFSQFRSASFNESTLVQNYRFQQPYNALQALLAELGVLGILCFLAIILLTIGSAMSAWLTIKQSLWKRMKERLHDTAAGDDFTAYAEVSVVLLTWLMATIGLCFTFFDAVLWWVWWTLLAIVIVSLSAVSPKLIKDRSISVVLSPQYSLLLSFGLLILFTSVVVGTVYVSRQFIGLSHFHNGAASPDLTYAMNQFQQAKSYQPTYAPYDTAIARTYLELARQQSTKQASDIESDQITLLLSQGIAAANNAVDHDPLSVSTWETLALLYLNIRPIQDLQVEANNRAKEAYEQAQRLEPANPEWAWRLGNISLFQEEPDIDRAIQYYTQAIALRKDYIVAYKELADVYESQERFDEAIETYLSALPRAKEKTPELLYHVGRLYYNRNQKGDKDLAQAAWTQAITLLPDYANALYSLGLLAEEQGKISQARTYFERVQVLNPDNADVEAKINSLP